MPLLKQDSVDVSLQKELARVGLNSFDVVSGTGDGGGEDEGNQGIHEHLENVSPWRVRRRRAPPRGLEDMRPSNRGPARAPKRLCCALIRRRYLEQA